MHTKALSTATSALQSKDRSLTGTFSGNCTSGRRPHGAHRDRYMTWAATELESAERHGRQAAAVARPARDAGCLTLILTLILNLALPYPLP